MGNGVHATTVDVPGFWHECKDLVSMIQDPRLWPNFSTELKELMKMKSIFTKFSIVLFLILKMYSFIS